MELSRNDMSYDFQRLQKFFLICLMTLAFAPLRASSSLAVDCGRAQDKAFRIRGVQYCHVGGGRFLEERGAGPRQMKQAPRVIDLRKIEHAHNRAIDRDVPLYTNITLPGVTPDLVDRSGREYALITLYNVDPPLDDIPSTEPGIDRGLDFRDPSNLVRSAYSNYVSPVLTNDKERKSVPGHPIGHFYVKVEIPGYPAILTGMTTTARADSELVDFTLARQLGIGGVLLTPQPGRLNSAAEATEELGLRQRELVVIDGLYYRVVNGRNVGPTYVVKDGNVVFARFRVPRQNAKDALNAFLGFVDNGTHNTFGSLLSRPNRGDGAGCSAFAMFWLKSAGIIPFVDEAAIPRDWTPKEAPDNENVPLWMNFYNRIGIPWQHIGCDNRVGLTAVPPQPAAYTVYDNLFHNVPSELVRIASEGLAEKIRKQHGQIVGTLFRYGALTPLRDLVISSKRKDPDDRGHYAWTAKDNQGLVVGFWDNNRFSKWVKKQWGKTRPADAPMISGMPVRTDKEGRFRGVEVNALTAQRAKIELFERTPNRVSMPDRDNLKKDCRSLFSLATSRK